MLETLIKRDGTHQKYMPGKANRWAVWAARGRVDWSSILLAVNARCKSIEHSQTYQQYLIDECNLKGDWEHRKMAGALYAPMRIKALYGEHIPTVRELQHRLLGVGLMTYLNYTDDEFEQIEKIIDHKRDQDYAHFQLHQIRMKYSISNANTGEEYESAQFVFMRMAMALAEVETNSEKKLIDVKAWYDHFSLNRINAPTPNYVNLGTSQRGYASCCVIYGGDSEVSIEIADHIASRMTASSAGIGGYLGIRSVGDPVRGGRITHSGKLPYYNARGGNVKKSMQAGRGGSDNEHFTGFDPEVITLCSLQNPRSPDARRNRQLTFTMIGNSFLAKKAAMKNKEDRMVFSFNAFTAPDLHEKFFTADTEGFEALYKQYEENPNFEKKYLDARQIVKHSMTEGYNVGTLHQFFADEANRHTPFLEPIHSGNLCIEICLPTSPYQNVVDLYSTEDHGRGEVALCTIGGLIPANIHDDEMYLNAAYYALKMADRCIDLSEYRLPHVGFTAKQRRSVGIGVVGLAYCLALKGLRYDSQDGRNEVHRIYERHMYHLIRASLKIAKERGNAPWIHKTKWPQGWLPIDTYKRTIDEIVTVGYQYDWEELRGEIITQGGIAHSVVCAHMPTESSSKAAGMPNGPYPLRAPALKKSDGTNIVDWCAPGAGSMDDQYQLAWDIDMRSMIQVYGIIQKFTDQGISPDTYRDRTQVVDIKASSLVSEYLDYVRYGLKGRYYPVSRVSAQQKKLMDEGVDVLNNTATAEEAKICEACIL